MCPITATFWGIITNSQKKFKWICLEGKTAVWGGQFPPVPLPGYVTECIDTCIGGFRVWSLGRLILLPFPSPPLPSSSLLSLPSLPLPLEVGPLSAARESGGALKLPQRVRAEPGRQTFSGAYRAESPASDELLSWSSWSQNDAFWCTLTLSTCK